MKPSHAAWMIALIGGFAVASCQSLPLAEIPTAPSGWQMQASAKSGASDCRRISGVFSTESDSLVYGDHGWEQAATSQVSYFGLFVGPAQSKGHRGSSMEREESLAAGLDSDDWIAMDFVSGSILVFQYPVALDRTVEQISWSEPVGDFSCNGDRIEFPIVIDLSGGEGMSANIQRQVSVGVSDDGALLVYDVISQAKSSAFRSRDPTFQIYRFKRIR